MSLEKYCLKCGYEMPEDGMTMYEGKRVCECDEKGKERNWR